MNFAFYNHNEIRTFWWQRLSYWCWNFVSHNEEGWWVSRMMQLGTSSGTIFVLTNFAGKSSDQNYSMFYFILFF